MSSNEKFVGSIFNEILEDNFIRYKNSLSKVPDEGVDVYAKARRALSQLSDEDKEAIFNFFKITITDTASIILGTIDGSHFPSGIDNDFKLIYGDEEIQGELQDLFIEKVEDKGIYN
ncbi:hypothetical protein [Pectobacterium zantedeschiae]|uniref:hypothetical protein n=1 Tax=Pectobacterium zantedeschiae TaxID=2034769 RepID=UPI00101C5BC5|nr:hypothetical protein [Pectobacterium zantedeschiae]RYC37102.1 hypothetical protein DEH81_21645 [Pectobacterium zantedeschiae]